MTESTLKRPESFNLTGNVGYGVFAEAQQQGNEEGWHYDNSNQIGSRRHAIYRAEVGDINEMESYSVYDIVL